MAMSSAEKMRALRTRRKAEREDARRRPPKSATYIKGKFSEFVGNRTLDLHENLDAFGAFIAGSGLDEEHQTFASQVGREAPLTSLERAHGLQGAFLDAAKEIAELINAFKLAEIEQAIEGALEHREALPKGDVVALKAALAEIERLMSIRSELRRPTRHSMASVAARAE